MSRYQIRRKPGRLIRVVDLEENQVEGYWFQDRNEWFDFQQFMEKRS